MPSKARPSVLLGPDLGQASRVLEAHLQAGESARTAELCEAIRKRDDDYGLGLYIVRLIVESHGGQVEARKLPGETGAEFLLSCR